MNKKVKELFKVPKKLHKLKDKDTKKNFYKQVMDKVRKKSSPQPLVGIPPYKGDQLADYKKIVKKIRKKMKETQNNYE